MRRARHLRTTGAALITVALLGLSPALAVAQSPPSLGDSWTDQARHFPGSRVTVTTEATGTGTVTYSLVHLGEVVTQGEVHADGRGQVQWTFTAPDQDGTGYLVQANAGGSQSTTAVDVSSTWTLFPRMGYLDSYPADMDADSQRDVVNELVRDYHLNSLQYYDWMWRHEDPLQRTGSGELPATWSAWNGDVIAPATVSGLISAGHDAGVAALPYSMSYAALTGYESGSSQLRG